MPRWMLQCGHGWAAVGNVPRLSWQLRGSWLASMRPRLGGRGKRDQGQRVEEPAPVASMRPRLGGRGKPGAGGILARAEGRFNAATAGRPWETPRAAAMVPARY